MRPQTVSLTGTGQSAWIPVNSKQTPFNVGLAAVVNGTVTYTIQHTFDNVLDPVVAAGTITAFDNSGLTGQTANKDGNYAFPISAIRINNTAGTGTTTLTIMQGA